MEHRHESAQSETDAPVHTLRLGLKARWVYATCDPDPPDEPCRWRMVSLKGDVATTIALAKRMDEFFGGNPRRDMIPVAVFSPAELAIAELDGMPNAEELRREAKALGTYAASTFAAWADKAGAVLNRITPYGEGSDYWDMFGGEAQLLSILRKHVAADIRKESLQDFVAAFALTAPLFALFEGVSKHDWCIGAVHLSQTAPTIAETTATATFRNALLPGWKHGDLTLTRLPNGPGSPAIFTFRGTTYTVPCGKAWYTVCRMIEESAFDGHGIAMKTPSPRFNRANRAFFNERMTKNESGWFLKTV